VAKKIGSRTITVVRKPKVDRLATTPAGTPPEHDIEGCAILPRTSHEEDRGWVVVEGRMVIAPYGADVLATDLVKVDGETWEVDGAPGDYEDRRAKGKATIFYLKKQGT
jgi:hypothetical protein